MDYNKLYNIQMRERAENMKEKIIKQIFFLIFQKWRSTSQDSGIGKHGMQNHVVEDQKTQATLREM